MSPYREAIERFRALLEAARATDIAEPTACALATCGSDGWPAVRMVLLKGVDEDGFVFYTNRRSRKGRQLAENPRAALCFHWHPIGAQVQVEGVVTAVADDEADRYFATRPRLAQLGAWASRQSEPLADPQELEAELRRYLERYPEGSEVPRPPHWSGYRLVPAAVEFWSAGDGRLHERERYAATAEGWTRQRLYP